MKDILNFLFQHKTLTKAQAKEILKDIAAGKYNQCEIASFLTVFVMRQITVEELDGFTEALRELCVPIDLSDYDAIDMCGTGGDGKNTFNISTTASFVVAGVGVKVAKHGNYGVSSGCGSSNVLEALGYQFTNDESKLRRDIEEAGICFLHAPLFHPAMKEVAPVRKQMGVRTFFNMAGPLVNPSFPKRQVVGVFNLELARLYKYLLEQTDKQYVILHSLDVYDEISLTSPFKMITNKTEKVLSPEDIGLHTYIPEQLGGGDTVEEAVQIFKQILQGKGTQAQNEVVYANAAMGIQCAKPNVSIADALAMAKESVESGKAYEAVRTLVGK